MENNYVCFCKETFLDPDLFKKHLADEHDVHTFEGGDFIGTVKKIIGRAKETQPQGETVKDAAYWESKLSLNIVYRQKPLGITETSKDLFKAVRGKIDAPIIVYLICTEEPRVDYLTYVSDSERKTLCFDGFSWGYAGEGPHGLEWLFKQLGFNIDITQIAALSNKPGCTGVQSDGLTVSPAHAGEWLH